MRRAIAGLAILLACLIGGPAAADILLAECSQLLLGGLRDIAPDRTSRFLGKVEENHARCFGDENGVSRLATPWVDWANYRATRDGSSKSALELRNKWAITGALYDLEYQRMELIKFNLFDNSGTFERYLRGAGADTPAGATLKVWSEMRLPPSHPSYPALKVEADGQQQCIGRLIRHRTLTGICNDINNPAMGASGQLFARNVEFETTFPELGRDEMTRNRHGDRIGLLKPDPQVISRKLFTRDQTGAVDCNQGAGARGAKTAVCPYQPASFFNVLAAYWIQFMTHDWFSHLDDARNDQTRMLQNLGCAEQLVDGVARPLSPDDIARLGCRPGDKIDAGLVAQDDQPGSFKRDGRDRLTRAHKTTRNMVTAWVGRLADLRLRRELAAARPPRSDGFGQAAA
jgi:hypothetical protein